MLWIVIEAGELFEGTLAEFQDCYFSNATRKRIKNWCDHNEYHVAFSERPDVPEDPNEIVVVLTCAECKQVLGRDRYAVSPYTGRPTKRMAWHPACYEHIRVKLPQAQANTEFVDSWDYDNTDE